MKCILIGGGGHGRVLLETVNDFRPGVLVGVLDAQPGLDRVGDVPVLGGDEMLPGLKAQGFTHFLIGVGSSKSCTRRAELYVKARKAGLEALSVIHPAAWISHSAVVSAGCQVLAKAVVNTGAKLGGHVLVNSGAIVEHDCVVGAHTHIATGAVLCGDVKVGELSHIGAGAVVRQGIRIGARAVVGAGAVVVKDVPEGALVVGVPARIAS
ncbi:MAG: NeuD/PglB/VioB family sugar acetyltransferase [Verrucomicrobiaceae bacterium]|jgi:sugar O-acyltransferase (sialic acid O-acetyltransferase NeuD family)|nr:NeuD/PglB/VioB family sugar acetyltransferase [Verrucomicrobiaceae bacterium]